MPAEADLLCDYYISSNLKSTKRSNSSITPSNLLKLNSQLSDSMSSLSSTTSSLTETIDFVKYEKNPMEFLKAKYPVLNGLNKKEIDYQKTESSNTRMTNQANKILEIQSNIENNWSKIKKNGVGLLNLGNNCYLNATLQCLAYTPPLSQWLITRTHSSSCRFKQLKGFCSLCEVEKITFDIFNSFNGCAKPNALCFNIKSKIDFLKKFLFFFK
jgi:ubiquitin C-terminal hydrolase